MSVGGHGRAAPGALALAALVSALVFLVATFVLGAILGGVVNGFTDSPDPVVVALYVASTIVQALADAVAPGQMRSDEVMQARLWHVVSGARPTLRCPPAPQREMQA